MLEEDVKDFLLYIASEKGLSHNTIEAYERDILTFVDYLKEHAITSFHLVQSEHLVGYLARKKDRGYASASICRALIALKVLFAFLKRERMIEVNHSLYLDTPKLWQLIPEYLTLDEVERLLAQPATGSLKGDRDKAMLEVLYSSGLRVSEICTLGIFDVDDTYVRVKGKGNKERLVPIGSKALAAIDTYLSYPRQENDPELLFLTRTAKPMDRVTVWKLVKEYAKQAGISKNISPHTLRHSFATHLLDHGADLRVIQDMLGHANIRSTDRYTHISRQHLQEAFQRCQPASPCTFPATFSE